MDQRDADTRAASRRLLAGDAGTQQRTRQAMRLLERALGEIRNFIGAFRPPGFERRALGEIIERSEEHTSELQSHSDLVCRLLLEKKKQRTTALIAHPRT